MRTRGRIRMRRLTPESLLTLAFIAAFTGSILHPTAVVAAPLSCLTGAASPVATPPASLPTKAPPLPTEAAIAPEVNPPGDIPDNQAFVTYTSTQGGYAITMPEGWARQESGPDVSFVDKLHRFTVEVSCADAAPTVETAQRVDASRLAQQIPAFELVEVKPVDLPAGPAILLRYRMNSIPDDVTGKQIRLDVDRYELFKDGRLVAISLAVPAGSDNVDVSNQISRSFQWTAYPPWRRMTSIASITPVRMKRSRCAASPSTWPQGRRWPLLVPPEVESRRCSPVWLDSMNRMGAGLRSLATASPVAPRPSGRHCARGGLVSCCRRGICSIT
jgi:hypothetical protein